MTSALGNCRNHVRMLATVSKKHDVCANPSPRWPKTCLWLAGNEEMERIHSFISELAKGKNTPANLKNAVFHRTGLCIPQDDPMRKSQCVYGLASCMHAARTTEVTVH